MDDKYRLNQINSQLSFLGKELVKEIMDIARIETIPKGTEIIRQYQYIKFLPIVLSGLVSVYSKFEERELLLYYIEPSQSCVMSFSAYLKNKPSRIYAVTEEESDILLMPIHKMPTWLNYSSRFNALFYEQYDLRYTELLDTMHHILLKRMDERLYKHLCKKSELIDKPIIKISHSQIANELGTVREVISRVMKKLEVEGKVIQHSNYIEIL